MMVPMTTNAMTRYFSTAEKYALLSETERKQKLLGLITFDRHTGQEFCSICRLSYQGKYASGRKRLLMNHIEREHLKIAAYDCEYCMTVFYSKAQKASHIHQHHREQHKFSKVGL
jgi:hypothetical protein